MTCRPIIGTRMRSGGSGGFLRGSISRRILDQLDEKSLRVRARKLLIYDGLGGGRQHILGIDVGIHVRGFWRSSRYTNPVNQ